MSSVLHHISENREHKCSTVSTERDEYQAQHLIIMKIMHTPKWEKKAHMLPSKSRRKNLEKIVLCFCTLLSCKQPSTIYYWFKTFFPSSVVVNHIIFSSILRTYSHFLSFYMSLKKDGGGKLRSSLWTTNHLTSYTLNPPAIRIVFFFPVCSLCLFISRWFLFLT